MPEHEDGLRAAPLRWPRRGDAQRPVAPVPPYAYLLDEDDDLAEEFDVRARLGAGQQAKARVLKAKIGECDLTPWLEAARGGIGLLIMGGLLALDTTVGDRTATELLGSGDLLQPPDERSDELVTRSDECRVLHEGRIALLDAEFAARVRPWPQIMHALLRRVGRRLSDVDALRAITAQPRLELRLVLVLWHLASRWGRVEPAGIRVTMPLTHRLLGQLVSAERPSVSHAMHRLAEAGLITGTADDLHLHGTLDGHLASLIERAGAGERVQSNGAAHEPIRW